MNILSTRSTCKCEKIDSQGIVLNQYIHLYWPVPFSSYMRDWWSLIKCYSFKLTKIWVRTGHPLTTDCQKKRKITSQVWIWRISIRWGWKLGPFFLVSSRKFHSISVYCQTLNLNLLLCLYGEYHGVWFD